MTITSLAASGKEILTHDPGKNSERGQGEDLRVVEMMAVMTEIMEGKMSWFVKAGSKTGFHKVALYGSGRVLFVVDRLRFLLSGC